MVAASNRPANKRQVINIRGHITQASAIWPGIAQALAGLLQLGARIIQQDNFWKALIAGCIPPGARAQF